MKVKDLRKAIKDLDGELDVYIGSIDKLSEWKGETAIKAEVVEDFEGGKQLLIAKTVERIPG